MTTLTNSYTLADAKLSEIRAWEEYDRSIEAWLYSAEHQLIPADKQRTDMLRRAKEDHYAKAIAAAERVHECLEEERYEIVDYLVEADERDEAIERGILAYPGINM